MDSLGPLQGVTITEKGKSKASISDENGFFEIHVSGPNAILVFSFVGYQTEELALEGKSTVTIILKHTDFKELGEVVVTALGIPRSRRSLGYSVGEIKGADMNRVTQTNVLNSMAAKVSGVNVNSTGGSPTASVSVIIRGIHSLNSDNQPLFVIDGAPVKNSMNNISTNMGNDNDIDYGNAISDLNPNDIESISILKGPSAAALYGSRAGNGVVIITTKTGKKSKGIGITFNSMTEFDIPYHYLPTNQSYTVGNHPYTTPNSSNSWNDKIVDLEGTDTYRFGTPLNFGIKAIQWNSPLLADSTYEEQKLVSHNNLKNFMQTGLTLVNSIAVENASEKDIYRLSYANLFNQGIVPNTGLKRNNIAFNLQHSVTKSFRINLSLNFVNSSSDNVVAGNDGGVLKDVAYLSPSVDIRQMKNYWLAPGIQQLKALPPVGVDGSPDTPRNNMANTDFDNNPWFTLNQVKNSFKRNRLFGNVKLDYSFSAHVNAFLRYSQDLYNETRETKISKSYNGEPNGYYGIQNLHNTESNTDFLFNYNNNFGNFNLAASAGGNMLYSYSSNLQTYSQSGAGIIVPELFNVSNIAQANLRSVSGYSEKMVYSLYATASLGFRDMAYLDLTGRNDWSSTLPSSNNSYFYPSASLAVLLSRIFNLGSAISLAKLRAGWASVGKDTDPYNLYGTIGIGSFGGITTQQGSSTIKNPNLKPEQAISTELGLELAFFKNRLHFDGTVYQADYDNQILNINTPPSSGYTSRQINGGLIRTKGIELQIGGTIVSNKDWRWDLSLNYTKNNSYVISLSNNVPFFLLWQDGESGSWTYAKGQRIPNTYNADGSPKISDGKIGQIWDNRVVTVTDMSSMYYGYPILGANGYYQKVGDGDFNYKEVVGNFNPKLLMGMQTSLRYKSLTLTASFDMRLGGTFFSQTYRYLQSDGVMARQMNIGIPIPNAYKNNIPAYLNSNPDKFIRFSGLQQFHLVGGPNLYQGGLPYTDGGITFNDGAFYPGLYLDANGRYVENLGDPNLTKFDYYTDAITTPTWDFARMNIFDASFIKMREITISVELPSRFANSLKLQSISVGIFSKNIILWTKAKVGIDPELAFQYQTNPQGNGSQFRQGIERYNITPWSIPIGVNLNVRF